MTRTREQTLSPEIPPAGSSGARAPASLRQRPWKRFLRGPDPELLNELYEPALSAAVRYDRCCSYFSSTVLAAAARGFGGLIARLEALAGQAPRPAVRLVVNEELAEEDVRAMTETGDLSRLEAMLQKRFKTPKDRLEKERLGMLAWLVKRGLLEVRVGVMRRGAGIVHAKFGVITDEAGDAVVFSGSGNESAQGLLGNYERLEVSTSWEDPDRHREYSQEFAALWADRHPDVHTVPLPEALRLRLVKLAPKEPLAQEPASALARQKAAMLWHFIVEAPYLPNGEAACDATALVDLWPHQRRVVEETASAWPDGRLLCDEVGMGKTIEAILILRRLLAGRGVRRVLILLPAGLLKQWQGELREKGGLVFPRLEGPSTLIWPDERVEKVEDLAQALERDVLLISRETARTENNLPVLLQATPWDLVVLDEAHAARRRSQVEGEFNSGTLLLTLLRQLQLRRRARSFLLLSATPMQTHPWEPWDLLQVLGEGGAWLAEFGNVRDFYAAAAAVGAGRCDLPTARKAAALIAADPAFPPLDGGQGNPDTTRLAQTLAFSAPTRREELAQWLRRGSPLGRRMHRNTRRTLRQYYELGLLPDPPPTREVQDLLFDYNDQAEREVYNAVTRYIERRFTELEREKPGKGFVMTIYRRRASSSPYALEQSLKRRQTGLRRVEEQKAYAGELRIEEEEVDARDLDDLGEFDAPARVSAAFPSDPQVARAELVEVGNLLADLRGLGGRDTKRDKLFDLLRQVTDDGRAVLVFTEYADTMDYLREHLVTHYGTSLGCFSGAGGEIWDGTSWKAVTKDTITGSLRDGELRVLLCTDAASEGLNLQAAGALINYDLPWNPSRVEQRIGRIDRIGQKHHPVRVINLFLRDSVDERVYRVLRTRCGLFEHFVGAMQPVLASARRMLLGQESLDVSTLDTAATQVQTDLLANETYVESEASGGITGQSPLTRMQLQDALALLTGDVGLKAKSAADGVRYVVSALGCPRLMFGSSVEALEHDRSAEPLTPLNPRLNELLAQLRRPGERLPLVIGAYQAGAFRRSIAYWVDHDVCTPVESFADLEGRVKNWTGEYPDPHRWVEAERAAQAAAAKQVWHMESQAAAREAAALQRQTDAARLRLLRELGRYLMCLGAGTADLNGVLYQQLNRDIATAQRLQRCLDRLGGNYPEWPDDLCRELSAFFASLTENQRKARLLGKELDAALDDPRWLAATDCVRSGAQEPRAPTAAEIR
jgi:superfamily II DNA or RNA helicase